MHACNAVAWDATADISVHGLLFGTFALSG